MELMVLLGLPFLLGWVIGDSLGYNRGLKENQDTVREAAFREGVKAYRTREWLLSNDRAYNNPINQDLLNRIDAELETSLRQGQRQI